MNRLCRWTKQNIKTQRSIIDFISWILKVRGETKGRADKRVQVTDRFEMWGYQLCGENQRVTKVSCNILVRFNFLNKHETITSEARWPRSEQLSPVSGQEQWRQQRPESLLNGGKRSWEVFFWENSCHVKNRMIGLNHAGYCAVRGGEFYWSAVCLS